MEKNIHSKNKQRTKRENIIRTAGAIKIIQQRLASYISMINFIMIFYLYIIESPMELLWYQWIIIIFSCISILIFIDTRYIMPASLAYTFYKNPEFNKLQKQVLNNSEKLDKLLQKNDRVVKWKKQQ